MAQEEKQLLLKDLCARLPYGVRISIGEDIDYFIPTLMIINLQSLECGFKEFAWIHGVEWADQHPREGLWDAEKVIKWLQDNADSYTWYDEFEGESGMTDDFIEDLRKAMEN